MQRLDHCSNCGSEVPGEAVFCPNCGFRVTHSAFPKVDWDRHPRHIHRENDWWGLVSAAGFLVVVGLTVIAYPDALGRIVSYLESFGVYGHPVLPSYNLGAVLIYFFNLAGIWGLIAGALRFLVTGSGARAGRDIVGALFSLYTADILGQFYSHLFGGWDLVGMWIVGLAVVIVADALISLFVPKRIPLPIYSE